MKNWFGLMAVFGLGVLAMAQNTSILDQVVVTVNDKPILERDLRREALIFQFLASQSPFFSSSKLESNCYDLNKLSNLEFQSTRVLVAFNKIQTSILQSAVKDIQVKEEDVTALTDKVRKNFADSATFTRHLQCTEQSEETWKNELLFSLALKAKVQQIETAVSVTQDEIETYYTTYQFRYMQPARILARVMALPTRQKTLQVFNELKKGKDFSSLARQNSVILAEKSGALGAVAGSTTPQPVSQNQMQNFPKALVEDSFTLIRGGITRVVKAGDKWYILQVLQYLPPSPPALQDIQGQVEKDTRAVKARGLVEAWKEQAWNSATIRFAQDNFSPIVARVNGRDFFWHDMFNLYRPIFESSVVSFMPFFAKDNSDVYKEFLSQAIRQQGIKKANFQGIGNQEDNLNMFLSQIANGAVVTEAEAKAYYQARIKSYQMPNQANVATYFFGSEQNAQEFRRQALALGDIPTPNKAGIKLDFDSGFTAKYWRELTRSAKNDQMYVSVPFPTNDSRWMVDMVFFPTPAYTKTFEMVKDSIIQVLQKQKREGEQKRWIATQNAEIKIENLLPNATKELERRTVRW